MKKLILTTAISLATSTATAGEVDKAALAAEGKAIIGSFAETLQGELIAAMKEGGSVNAIDVCNVKAPEVAASAMDASGWFVGRSSHKLRSLSNEPDDYTAAVIEEFLAREADGEKAVDIVKAEIVESDGVREFRMTKAIPTSEPCLNCHAAEIKPEVEAKLTELYPDDLARGFEVGQMRGVFVLSKVLD